MRATGIAALTATITAGLALPPAVASEPGRTATPPSAAVASSPAPGERFAPPQSDISFRGISPAALGAVRVTGSRSGVHAGSLVADPAGATIWQPRVQFRAGERVTVQTTVPIAGANGDSFTFTVARIAPHAPKVLPDNGAGPEGAPNSAALQVAACTPALSSYRSEPGLTPPAACVNQPATGTAPGYLFTTPVGGTRGNGAAIFDNDGNLVWYDPVNAASVANLEPVTYQHQPMLAFYQGAQGGGHSDGEFVLMDQHYQVVSYIRAGNGVRADLHELTITPQDTALVGAYEPVQMDLRSLGGTANQVVYDYVVQEIDVATGRVFFTWHALDHVPLSDSDYAVPADGSAYDYFHGNSIQLSLDGNLLISGRNASAVYIVNRITGRVMFTVGGKHSSFALQPTGAQWFCYQHHATQSAPDTVSIFDDGSGGPQACPNHTSRGLTLSLDYDNRTATITRNLQHDPQLQATIVGSHQTLPNGDGLVSWGNSPEVTEFNASDQPNFDMSLSNWSYRSFRAPWTGRPNYSPAVASSKGSGSAVTVYASWNGATQVASWQVLAGDSPTSLQPVGQPVPKTGFETTATVDSTATLVAAQAQDANGHALGTSAAVPTSYTPPAHGYYLGTQIGNVYNFGTVFYGSPVASGKKPAAPLVGTVVPPTGTGYYLPSSAGNVYNYGAPFFGSLAGKRPPSPVVGLAAYQGTGYYLATSGGNVYNYGSAPFTGSPRSTGLVLSAPVSGIAVDPTGGYWLAKRDGGVQNYGAPWYGSRRGQPLPAPVVGIAAEPNGQGYLLVTSKGNVYNFGQAPWYGSPGASAVHLTTAVVGIGMQGSTGYYVVCANGDVYNYGIPLPGSPIGLGLPAPVDGVGAR